ncbi:M48 family metalloprotease [Salarchaeum japonicum]|uniref:M48 family metalloprotease n=1 Tax=Salarchaeum japonicum TaxID=555573 RepID=UPI003C775F62
MAVASTVLLVVYLIVGIILAGIGGIWLAATGLPVLILLQYLLKVQLPLWSDSTGELTKEDAPELHRQAEHLAEEFDISKPSLYVADRSDMNAFALGRQGSGKVVIHRGLLQRMSPDEVEPILAHEFAHLKNRDSILMALGTSIVSIVSAGLFLLFVIASLDSDRPWLVRIIGGAVSAFVHFFLQIFVGMMSRYREYVADEDAVRATGKYDGMRRALSKLQSEKQRVDVSDTSATRSAINFVDFSGGIADLWLFRTHPPLDKRISRIERLESEVVTDSVDSPSTTTRSDTFTTTDADESAESLTDRELLSRIQSMDEYEFEHLVGDLWEEIGWRTSVTTASKDRGVDVVAERESPYYQKQVIQAKCYSSGNTVSSSEVQQYAGLHLQEDNVDAVVVVTTSRFTSDARDVASDSNVKLVNGGDLCELIRTLDTDISIDRLSS